MFLPTRNLRTALRNSFAPQLFPWDEYFPQMAEADFLAGRHLTTAVKTFFIRKAPFGGSYALLGGITAALNDIALLRFDDPDFIRGMQSAGYNSRFIDWLKQEGMLRVKVYAPPEGSLMFPNEPIITVFGPLAHIRLIEGIITEACNFASLSLTKWHRLVRTVRPGHVLDFSRRRAQNSMKSTLYSMLAGCFGTSNSEVGRYFDVRVLGTMGHEWIQSFGDVLKAFDTWLENKPHRPIGLIDTLRCLEHDFPAWLESVYMHRESIKNANAPFWGWRNDSGDLSYLTIEQYRRFMSHQLARDTWFREKMRITLTNELDEHSARSIIEQIRTQAGAAGLDAEDIIRRIIWAAGTKPGTCEDQSSLGGVMKLVEVDNLPCIKLAFDAEGNPGIKTSIPGFNRSALIRNESGEFVGVLVYPHRQYEFGGGKFYYPNSTRTIDVIEMCHQDNPASRFKVEEYTATEQQSLVFDSDNGGFTQNFVDLSIEEVAKRIMKQVDSLHWSMARLEKPHAVKVSVTPELFDLRRRMIAQGVLRSDFLK